MLTIIGLVGAKGAGKNTFARMLTERLQDAREGALADRLKDSCAAATGIPRDYFDDPSEKERYIERMFPVSGEPVCLSRGPLAYIIDSFGYQPTSELIEPHVDKYLYTPRQVAQYVGTEVLRGISPEIHCLGLMKDQRQEGYLVVTDIRFPNELQFFQSLEPDVRFISIAVRRAAAEAKAATDAHASERHTLKLAEKCTHQVQNEGAISDLEDEADCLTSMFEDQSDADGEAA